MSKTIRKDCFFYLDNTINGDLMLLVCLKIFFARIVDVSLGTIRTVLFVKGKVIEPFIVAFFEVIIWFVIAKEALNIAGNTLLIAVFYAAGYATGTLIGSYLSKTFVSGHVLVEVITNTSNNNLIKELRSLGYKVCIFELKKDKHYDNLDMLYLQVDNKSIKKVTNIIYKHDSNAFITINETKYVSNGLLK